MKKVKFRAKRKDDGTIYNDIWFSGYFDSDWFIEGCCWADEIIIEMLTGIDEKGNEIWEEIDND